MNPTFIRDVITSPPSKWFNGGRMCAENPAKSTMRLTNKMLSQGFSRQQQNEGRGYEEEI
jgi:hypothetical protein